jgi:hypothetical protein
MHKGATFVVFCTLGVFVVQINGFLRGRRCLRTAGKNFFRKIVWRLCYTEQP